MIDFNKLEKIGSEIPEKDQLTIGDVMELSDHSKGKFDLVYQGFKLGYYRRKKEND